MSDAKLSVFLEGLGLAEYFDTLASERIELQDLALLSDDDLASLGLPLGPRRRLLRAVRDGAPPPPHAEGERRNLTVLFCDMVGSTKVASQMDPEDLSTYFRSFRHTCAAAIEAEGGFVAHRLGDGLMALFGYPRALEDAAIRAVRAGLEIVERIARAELPGDPIEVRIGVASGMTVIEQARAGFIAEDEMATGATLALASRLQALAPPGGVLVSDATRRMLRDAFDLRPMGPKALKGFPQMEVVWRVGPKTHLDLPGDADLQISNTLVGREAERAELLSCWQQSLMGKGSAVILEGEAGIGKSRLLAELRKSRIVEGDIIFLKCSRYRHGAALHPVADWLRAAAGDVDAEERASRLARLTGVSEGSLQLLSGLIGLRPSELAPETDPARRQAMIIEAVIDLLAPSGGRPRMVLVEDVQWADVATMDVLDRLADHAREASVLFVATARPGAARLPRGPQVRKISLGPLSPEATRAVISAQQGAKALSEAVCRTIAERSGGVPFFTEELTRAMVEAPNGDTAGVPITLQDTLMARLDRLEAGKPVAQIAALIGRSFTRDVLAASADLPDEQLEAGLAELVAANLLEARPGSTYAFRHALVRDAASSTLLKVRRKHLHRRVAEAMVTGFPALVEAQPETVAHHFTEAAEWEQAIDYWEKAAEHDLSAAAPALAMDYFNKAIALLSRLPGSSQRIDKEIALRTRLNIPLTVTTGFSSAQTEGNLDRMAALMEVTEPSEAALQLLWSRAMSGLVRADLVSARITAERMQLSARQARLPNVRRMPERILGYVAMLEGDLNAAETHFERVLDGYAPESLDTILPGHPFDVLASSLAQRAIVMALRGHGARVDDDQARALYRMDTLDNPATSFQVLVHLCIARFELGDHDGVLPLLADLRELVERNEMARLYVELWHGWATARTDDLAKGLSIMARARKKGTQYPLWIPSALMLEVDLLIGAGRHHEALALLDDCDAQIDRHRHTYLLAEAKRRRAACLSARGGANAEIEALLGEAVRIAAAQGTRRFEAAARQDLDRHRQRGPEGNATAATGSSEPAAH